MKYCFNCRRITAGEPVYCNFCGRSYDVKLCPRQHPNPRSAEVCSQCGSRELSIPQPVVPLWLRPMLGFLRLVPGALLLILLAGFFFYFLRQLLHDPASLLPLMLLGLMLGLLLYLWMSLPGFVRTGARKIFSRRRQK